MTPKHTPGPWEGRIERTCGQTVHYVNAGKRLNLYFNRGVGQTEDEMRANAQLIAAAPDLLEALQRCVSILSRYPSRDPNGEINGDMVPAIARAAIAKATGKAVAS